MEGTDLQDWYNEAGGHRIQRIPPTEKRGRVHTSTVTVAVMQSVQEPCSELREQDIETIWFSGTGPGGQNRNKVQACCRLRHVPTGLTAVSQMRTRSQSHAEAMADLARKLAEHHSRQQQHADRNTRMTQIGSGQRGDKIRTIQFQNDRAIDHRTDKKISAAQYMKGHMDRLW